MTNVVGCPPAAGPCRSSTPKTAAQLQRPQVEAELVSVELVGPDGLTSSQSTTTGGHRRRVMLVDDLTDVSAAASIQADCVVAPTELGALVVADGVHELHMSTPVAANVRDVLLAVIRAGPPLRWLAIESMRFDLDDILECRLAQLAVVLAAPTTTSHPSLERSVAVRRFRTVASRPAPA